ncbi:hypothetical protein JHK87_006522 [Glycine soja]|nr:hypothetical protein JHK87_006522 [Glycine soja]
MLFGSDASLFSGCTAFSYLHQENEHHINLQNVFPFRSYICDIIGNITKKTVYAFVGESSATKSFIENMEKQYVISKGEALVKGVGIGISLTYAAPNMQKFNQAKAAGYEVFQVIQRKPLIRKAILQGLSLSIPAGKTIALVGSSGCEKSTVIFLVEHVNVSKGGPLMARPIAIGKLKSRV